MIAAVVLIAAISGNGDDPDPAAAPTQPTVTITAQPSSAPSTETPVAAASTGATPAAPTTAAAPKPAKAPKPLKAGPHWPWTMPDEVGKDLQAAQDHIQGVTDNPFFFTDSMDATGADRFQILDVDWTVCSQKPAAGTSFTEDTNIVFYVVKDWEDCP